MVTNCTKYGLITGSASSEFLQLTELGNKVTSEEYSEYEKAKASMELGVLNVDVFKYLYETFKGNKLPQTAVMIDALDGQDVNAEDHAAVVDAFIVNIEQTGLLKTLSGAQRIVDIDHALEGLNTSGSKNKPLTTTGSISKAHIAGEVTSGNSHFDRT
ncbi:hypothetical protein ACE017_10630 [Shewanella mangrovisoli]|uniref:hypothetical protein n=1 Tax=Shewanella mangrovisoli TaxID=2864211 RepID=UPI0035BA9234